MVYKRTKHLTTIIVLSVGIEKYTGIWKIYKFDTTKLSIVFFEMLAILKTFFQIFLINIKK